MAKATKAPVKPAKAAAKAPAKTKTPVKAPAKAPVKASAKAPCQTQGPGKSESKDGRQGQTGQGEEMIP